MHDELPLFDALFVASVEAEAGDWGQQTAFPASSVEAYKRATRRCDPRVTWRYVSASLPWRSLVVSDFQALETKPF